MSEHSENNWFQLASEFLTAVMIGGDLTTVIRGHLVIEAKFNQILSSVLPNSKHIDVDRMRFIDKAKLLAALDLIAEEDLPPLLHLNKLRNKLAHNLEYEVSEGDLNEFLAAFGEKERNILTDSKLPFLMEEKQWSRLLKYVGLLAGMMAGLEDSSRQSGPLTHIMQVSKRQILDAVLNELNASSDTDEHEK